MDIKPGDLILVRGNDGLAHEIEAITHSPYSHVAGYVKPGQLIEAQSFRRTGYQSLYTYNGCADVYRCDELNDLQRLQIVKYVTAQIGSHYDYPLILWEAFRYLLKLTFPYYEGKNRICSTLWSDAYESVGVSLCPGIMYPTPGDIGNSAQLRKIGSL